MSKRRIYVCRPNGTKYAMLNGVDDDTISYTQNGKDFDSLEFTIDRFIYDSECNEIESTCYDDLHAYLNLYYDGIGYFQMQEPTVENDGYKETKQIKAYSKEKELAGKKLTGLKFNKGTKDSMEYLATDNIGDDGYAKKYCYIDSDNPELSILRIVLSKATGWSVGHVDETLLTKRISVEADDVNIYGFLTDIVAPKLRCVFDFDIQNLLVNVYDVD